MATYQYRCPGCGTFDVTRPMGRALPDEPCETCGELSHRVFTAPLLPRVPAPWPVPCGPRRPAPTNPAS